MLHHLVTVSLKHGKLENDRSYTWKKQFVEVPLVPNEIMDSNITGHFIGKSLFHNKADSLPIGNTH